jgi:hypothetical protein
VAGALRAAGTSACEKHAVRRTVHSHVRAAKGINWLRNSRRGESRSCNDSPWGLGINNCEHSEEIQALFNIITHRSRNLWSILLQPIEGFQASVLDRFGPPVRFGPPLHKAAALANPTAGNISSPAQPTPAIVTLLDSRQPPDRFFTPPRAWHASERSSAGAP